MAKYKELAVYRRSYEMVMSMYRYTKELPQEERYELASQIRRASYSIPTNIAEGYSKEDSGNETKRFLRMAKGSCGELEVLLSICKDVGYMEERHYKVYEKELDEISRMLYKLIESIE